EILKLKELDGKGLEKDFNNEISLKLLENEVVNAILIWLQKEGIRPKFFRHIRGKFDNVEYKSIERLLSWISYFMKLEIKDFIDEEDFEF
ncbi:MAG: hypothetical protein IH840_08325, partial [Candidatus Heimdallarchaeota archaeon]|nr:hypothetical protein [Candidatus Heimdallarchaeota archaeon]